MADVWEDERSQHGKWKVTADDGSVRYVNTAGLNARKKQLEDKLRQLETQKQREELRVNAELTQVEADIAQIAIEEAD